MSDQSLIQMTLDDFLDRLASDAPTPGGGSVAALTAALAASLGRMVCALTIGKPDFAEVKQDVSQISSRLTRAALLLRRLVDEDASAYGELHAAFKLKRSDDTRKQKIAEAAGLAAAVPLETIAVSRRVLSDLRRLEMIGNPNLRADMESGIHLSRAAMHAAAANVRANLPLLSDNQAGKADEELGRLLEE